MKNAIECEMGYFCRESSQPSMPHRFHIVPIQGRKYLHKAGRQCVYKGQLAANMRQDWLLELGIVGRVEPHGLNPLTFHIVIESGHEGEIPT